MNLVDHHDQILAGSNAGGASFCRCDARGDSGRVRALLAVVFLVTLCGEFGRNASAASSYVRFDASTLTWTIGNDAVRKTIRLNEDGSLVALGLTDLVRGVEWIAPGAPSAEIRVVFRMPKVVNHFDEEDAPEPGEIELTGASGWTLESETSGLLPDGTASVTLTLLSNVAPAAVALHLLCYPESPVFRTFLDVENRGDRPTRLVAADTFALHVGTGARPALFSVNNFTWAHPTTAFATSARTLEPGDVALLRTGPFGWNAAWFALESSAASGGLFGGWEWSGTGDFVFVADDAPGVGVALRAGLSSTVFTHVLAPGERFTAPAGFYGLYGGDWDDAGAATRAFVDRRLAPKLPAPDFPWVGFNTWGYSDAITADAVQALVDTNAELGAEFFVVDAGWMARLGDWTPDPAKFPDGLGPVAEQVRARGMKLGIWMAFGTADPDSDVAREHPDWLASEDGEPVVTDFGGNALCLADPRVREWVLGEVDRVVDGLKIDWLVHDFTVITRCDRPGHGHQQADGEWASTAGYYTVLDEIRRRHPDLVLENCWDGGSMMDFGMVARHDTSATNDMNDALGNQRAVHGGTYFLPPRYLDKYVGDLDGVPPATRFLSGVPGGPMIFMGTPIGWDDETLGAAQAAVALFKGARTVLRDGAVFHPRPDPGSGDVMAVESVSRVGSAAFTFAFAPDGLPVATTLRLEGLGPVSRYALGISHGPQPGDSSDSPAMTGGDLERIGVALPPGIPGQPQGVLVTLTRE